MRASVVVARGLSSCGSRALGAWASVVVAHGLSCSAACGIFPDQGSNQCPLHWQVDSKPLRHQGSPGQLIFNEGPKTIQSGRKFSTCGRLGQMHIHRQKDEVGPLPHTINKTKSKLMKGLNVRVKTRKVLGENIGVSLHDLGFQNSFLDMTPKA